MMNGMRNQKGAQVERLAFGGKMKDGDGYQIHRAGGQAQALQLHLLCETEGKCILLDRG